MSAERAARRARVVTAAQPAAASLAPAGSGDLDGALDRLLARRTAAAHAAGVAEGRATALADVGRAVEEALERLDASRVEALERVEGLAVELALEIARTLLRVELPAGRYDLERIVRETLACSDAGRGACVVHVNPVDAERLAAVPFRAGTEFEADHGVPAGSVHVTTPQGLLVRDLDQALASIRERLLGSLS